MQVDFKLPQEVDRPCQSVERHRQRTANELFQYDEPIQPSSTFGRSMILPPPRYDDPLLALYQACKMPPNNAECYAPFLPTDPALIQWHVQDYLVETLRMEPLLRADILQQLAYFHELSRVREKHPFVHRYLPQSMQLWYNQEKFMLATRLPEGAKSLLTLAQENLR
jgi:hypothetical protein